MAGIYIHIPFCRSACNYCDFYFTVDLRRVDELCNAVEKELEYRRHELEGEPVETIYFGGGTPSLIPIGRLSGFLDLINRHYKVSAGAEISLEANPEDLRRDFLRDLYGAGFNRLSIGIQSFRDEELKLLGRRHSGREAREAVERSLSAGFQRLSADLIFSIPGSNLQNLEWNLEQLFQTGVSHFSAYNLSYEDGTVMDYRSKRGRLNIAEEEESNLQFALVRNSALRMGYIPYEISNYCKNDHYSRHNTSYWQGLTYLGAGPGAHSYQGKKRRWNQSNLFNYLQAIQHGQVYWEEEQLEPIDLYNEYVMTRLRTVWGIREKEIEPLFGTDCVRHFNVQLKRLEGTGWIRREKGQLYLSEAGIYVADRVIRELFHVGISARG